MYNEDQTHQQTEAAPAPSEADHELARLEQIAAGHDQETNAELLAAAVGADTVLTFPHDAAAECETVLVMARTLLAPLYPSLEVVYSDSTIQKLSQAAAPVMIKYNLTGGGLLSKFGPELTLAAVAVPVALETIKAVRHDHAARIAANDEQAAAAALANGSN
ncbi:hypothetical protein HQ393_04590 [Chitinibacter bivalviorum]|uniref:Uncharacterized protein n=1 Tax=Chitinibacter bivalviorum TaxID=2739434 RepID=A0A7H9BGC0_9NEIS|nr:hypothetical protein [Chitinibacter bivalviorum]QLG87589.1 hypothetical protein HQ393_04590 [Chitinibacter bivalviorum]